jgi:hypothetical protein
MCLPPVRTKVVGEDMRLKRTNFAFKIPKKGNLPLIKFFKCFLQNVTVNSAPIGYQNRYRFEKISQPITVLVPDYCHIL